MPEVKSIGEIIRHERNRRGLTQAGLALSADVGKGRIEAIENGKGYEMGFGTVCAILVALGLEFRIHLHVTGEG